MAWKRRTEEERRAAGLPVPVTNEEPANETVQEYEDGVAVGGEPVSDIQEAVEAADTAESAYDAGLSGMADMPVDGDTQDLSAEPVHIQIDDDDDEFIEDGPMYEGEIEYEAQIDIHGRSDLPDGSSYKKKKKRKHKEDTEYIEQQGSSKAFKRIMTLCVIVVVLAIALVGFRLGYAIFNGDAVDSSADARSYVVVVEEGASVNSIISELSDNDIIGSSFIAKIQNKIFNYGLAVGTYTVDSSMTTLQILDYISEAEHSEGLPSSAQEETQAQTVAETESETAAEDEED